MALGRKGSLRSGGERNKTKRAGKGETQAEELPKVGGMMFFVGGGKKGGNCGLKLRRSGN